MISQPGAVAGHLQVLPSVCHQQCGSSQFVKVGFLCDPMRSVSVPEACDVRVGLFPC